MFSVEKYARRNYALQLTILPEINNEEEKVVVDLDETDDESLV